MEDVSVVVLDLAEGVFQVHSATSDGRAVCRMKPSWGGLPPCTVASLSDGPFPGAGDRRICAMKSGFCHRLM